jgi:hypothetical protein
VHGGLDGTADCPFHTEHDLQPEGHAGSIARN